MGKLGIDTPLKSLLKNDEAKQTTEKLVPDLFDSDVASSLIKGLSASSSGKGATKDNALVGELLGGLLGSGSSSKKEEDSGVGSLLGSLLGGGDKDDKKEDSGLGSLLGSLLGGGSDKKEEESNLAGSLLTSLLGGKSEKEEAKEETLLSKLFGNLTLKQISQLLPSLIDSGLLKKLGSALGNIGG